MISRFFLAVAACLLFVSLTAAQDPDYGKSLADPVRADSEMLAGWVSGFLPMQKSQLDDLTTRRAAMQGRLAASPVPSYMLTWIQQQVDDAGVYVSLFDAYIQAAEDLDSSGSLMTDDSDAAYEAEDYALSYELAVVGGGCYEAEYDILMLSGSYGWPADSLLWMADMSLTGMEMMWAMMPPILPLGPTPTDPMLPLEPLEP